MKIYCLLLSAYCALFYSNPGMANTINHRFNEVPVIFYKPDKSIKFAHAMGYVLPDTKDNLETNNAVAMLDGVSPYSDLGIKPTIDGGWRIEFLARQSFYQSASPISYVNEMNLNDSSRVNIPFEQFGKQIFVLDLFSSNANSDAMNTMLGTSEKIETLIMPFSGSYAMADIKLPVSLKNIVIYNQKVSMNDLNVFSSLDKLEKLVFWGCVFHVSEVIDLKSDPRIFSSLKELTVVNCDKPLSEAIKHYRFNQLTEVHTDEIELIRFTKDVTRIEFYAQKFNRSYSSDQDRSDYNERVFSRILNSYRSKEVNVNIHYSEK